MDRRQWCITCSNDWNSVDHTFDYKSRFIQKSLKYNPDPNATVRHHLRDTEEQRKYNDEHYELWGFEIDENGNEHFEYGKYMIFVTKEEHTEIHKCSEETKQKIGASQRLRLSKKDAKMGRLFKKGDTPWNKGITLPEETRKKISISRKGKCIGKSHPFYGKHHSEESLEKMCKALKEYWSDEDHHKQQSERCKGRVQSPETVAKRAEKLIGHETSEETRKKISIANSGRAFTDEHREKLCIARRKRIISEDTKSKTSESMKLVMSSEEHRKQISETVKKQKLEKKLLYDEYKANGGVLKWNDFQSFLKHKFKRNFIPTLKQLQDALTIDEANDIDVDDT